MGQGAGGRGQACPEPVLSVVEGRSRWRSLSQRTGAGSRGQGAEGKKLPMSYALSTMLRGGCPCPPTLGWSLPQLSMQ
jgi:hypothetical protein